MSSASVRGNLVAFAGGGLFAAGLLVSGMTRPEKVQGFLDLAGRWDASLALVMVGAIGVHATLLRVIRRRPRPVFEPTFFQPSKVRVDTALVAGAAVFGLGWGIAGYCPGPALVALGSGSATAVLFVVAMLAGMALQGAWADRRRHTPSEPPARTAVDA